MYRCASFFGVAIGLRVFAADADEIDPDKISCR